MKLHNIRARIRATLPAVFAAAAIAGTAGVSEARVEVLQIGHANPGAVAGFTIYHGTSSSALGTEVNIGRPSQNADGLFVYSLEVPDDDAVYVAVSAYDSSGQHSQRSDVQFRDVDASPPSDDGDPTEPGDTNLGAPGQPFPLLE